MQFFEIAIYGISSGVVCLVVFRGLSVAAFGQVWFFPQAFPTVDFRHVLIGEPDCAVLTSADFSRQLADENPTLTIAADVPAYIFYTSGTTGRPVRKLRSLVGRRTLAAGRIPRVLMRRSSRVFDPKKLLCIIRPASAKGVDERNVKNAMRCDACCSSRDRSEFGCSILTSGFDASKLVLCRCRMRT